MIRTEVVRVLAHVAAYDRRTVGEADVEAWHTALADISLTDALHAVDEHYRRSRDWLMPADVRTTARRLRGSRLEHAHRAPHPDVDPDDVAAWLAAHRQQLRAIADGPPMAQSAVAGGQLATPPVSVLPAAPTHTLSIDPHGKVTFP